MRFRRCLLLLLTGLALCAGCATPGASISAGRDQSQPRERFAPAAAAPHDAAARGLEVRWWVIDDAADDLLRLARTHGGSLEFLSEQSRSALAAHGFRIIRIPAARFAALAENLDISNHVSSDWLAQAGRWTGVMPGPWLPAGAVVRLGGRDAYLPAGRFELALRTWIVPTGGEPCLQLDLLPRFEPARERTLASLAGEAGRRQPVLEALTRLRLERGYVYLLTADAPSASWQLRPLDEEPSAAERISAANQSPGAADLVGPLTPATPTVGELLLRPAQAAGTPGLGRRAVAVFLPYLPSDASLLP